ncbi:TIGR00730 family Rossman fold protein [Lactiplantibacillus mudanjiangensis]|uniref:Cytokinin riboside 5'-monophosphate phosphoribohydrolase n=1 Tax=Lactiplantibacillus mudanjiangensis TaxID=1296538 RepID=A0A660DZA9_9LACO|nr:TIGR00730 family Rossman fold protein [Lactiplantibacillus mudanjiangensis]VDG17990.1 TIGR00730 family Rossman fold protein [Lactobacillus sp.] [Lactiplantibacillus mudanjiangensis]VDG24844.1 TIGR00730 family Rossman fold protein [Lactobacillus sp.] [Lactiplantibacillus mudanjiangensis]VDG28409.1 TIGR00730 family Rossman fold protein [Lactobacillus sp.] [Lactiplantibacillus mudanjiangensis]VDG32307.1 TIGR00730 family Rossman fold protein [Lactobacillus sp.] [Lactiplantibacillus mudanjiangens
MSIHNICVFCGSNSGLDPEFSTKTVELGQYLADNDYQLIYGGGDHGLMGKVATATLAAQGRVIGIIPHFLVERGLALKDVTTFVETKTMTERKEKMLHLADAFIVLPGGFGTFEEFLQMLSWSQMDIHQKPIALYNINGFYDPLIDMLQNSTKMGFAPVENLDLFIDGHDLDEIFTGFDQFNHVLPMKYTN